MMRYPNFQSITDILIRKIVLLSTLCGLLLAILHAYHIYLQSEKELLDTMSAVGAVYVPQLAISAWDIEPENITATIEGLVNDNDNIAYAKLELLSGYHFEAGTLADTGHFPAKKFTLFEPGTTQHTIGNLTVYPNASLLYKLIAFKLVSVLLGYTLLTFLICRMVHWLLLKHLQKPLKEIALFASTLDAEKLLTPIHLSHRENQRPNEIDAVVAGFEVLQKALTRHINHLDQMVADRTKQLEEALGAIQRLYITDQLTGCYNRHYLNHQLDLIFSSQSQQPVSVIFCDIDFFKKINDNYGHKAGDEVLTHVGHSLRESLRTDIDWVARFGGEEFIVVLPRTTLADALQVAERLRVTISKLKFEFRQQSYSATASFGVAQQQGLDDAAHLCERADQLLYKAKREGRNRVCS